MYTAGANAGQGAANGLASKREAVEAAARALADAANAAYKNRLNIHSPSRVMHVNGEDTAQGAINGILAKLNTMRKASTALAQSAIPDFKQANLAVANFRNRLASDLNVNGFNSQVEHQLTGDASINELNDKLDQIIDLARNGQVIVFDDGAFAGKLEPRMNEALGQATNTRGRLAWR